jgi:uncharacterized protein (DUF1015 family)
MRKGKAPHFDAACERLPAAFFNMSAPGLTILPTHRVLSGLGTFNPPWRLDDLFDVSAAPAEPERLRMELQRLGESAVTIAVAGDGGRSCFFLRPKKLNLAALLPDLSEKQRILDVVILHRLIIEKGLGIGEEAVQNESHIAYVREMSRAFDLVKSGKAQLAFLLNPTRLDHLRDISLDGQVMPQ